MWELGVRIHKVKLFQTLFWFAFTELKLRFAEYFPRMLASICSTTRTAASPNLGSAERNRAELEISDYSNKAAAEYQALQMKQILGNMR